MTFDYNIMFGLLDKLSPQIQEINNKISSLKNSVKGTTSKIQKSFDSIKTSKLNQELTKVSKKFDSVRSKAKETFQKGVGQFMAGGAILAAAGTPMLIAASFEKSFNSVKKSVDGSSEEMMKLKQDMKNIAAETGISFEEVSKAIDTTAKSGVPMQQLAGSTLTILKAAKALDFDPAVASAAMSKIIGMTGQKLVRKEATQEIADLTAHMEKLSNVNAGQFINVWQRASEGFAKMKWGNKEMAGMSASLLQFKISPEVAGTGFEKLAEKLEAIDLKPGSKTNYLDVIKKEGPMGLIRVLEDLKKNNSYSEITKDLGDVGRRMMDTILRRKKDLMKNVNFTKGAKGAVDREWSIYIDGFLAQMSMLKAKFMNIMESIGKPMLEVGKSVLKFLMPIIDWLAKFVQENKVVIAWIFGIIAAVGGLIAVLGAIAVAISAFSFIIGTLTAALAFVKIAIIAVSTAIFTTPVGWIILGIIAIVAALYFLIKYWTEITEFIKKWWKVILATLFPVIGIIWLLIKAIIALWNWFWKLEFVKNIVKNIEAAWSGLGKFFTGLGSDIANIWNNALDFVIEAFYNVKDKVVEIWDSIWTWIKNSGEFIRGIFANIFSYLGNLIKKGLKIVLPTILYNWLFKGDKKKQTGYTQEEMSKQFGDKENYEGIVQKEQTSNNVNKNNISIDVKTGKRKNASANLSRPDNNNSITTKNIGNLR